MTGMIGFMFRVVTNDEMANDIPELAQTLEEIAAQKDTFPNSTALHFLAMSAYANGCKYAIAGPVRK